MANQTQEPSSPTQDHLARRLNVANWGFFFLWLGIALIAKLSWGTGLLGLGLIELGFQWSRRRLHLEFEWFRLVAGALLAATGFWKSLSAFIGEPIIPGGLFAVLGMICGITLLIFAYRKQKRESQG